MEYDDLLNMGTELGYQLMFSGAEIYRVEESVYRLLTAYGLQPQVFAIPNCLIVSLNTPQGHPITRMRRIPSHGTDIELLERCNDLCRRLCREVPPVKQAQELVDGLSQFHPSASAGLCGGRWIFCCLLQRRSFGCGQRRNLRPGRWILDAVSGREDGL